MIQETILGGLDTWTVPIMEDCVSFSLCQFPTKDVGNNLVHIPTKQGGIPTSEGVIPTSEGVINAKQAILREIKGLFCTYQHVASTKFAPKCTFCPKNALFGQQIRFLLLPNRYTHPQEGGLVHLDYGPAVQNRVGGWVTGGRNGIFVVVERLRLWYYFGVSRQTF
jgi:hypothetical protein